MEKRDSKESSSRDKRDSKESFSKDKRDSKRDFPEPDPYAAIRGKNQVKPKDAGNTAAPKMIEVIVNDRLGKKVRVKCCPDDTIGDLKKLISAHTGTRPEKIRLQKSYNVYKDHITLADYEITHGFGLELYYN